MVAEKFSNGKGGQEMVEVPLVILSVEVDEGEGVRYIVRHGARDVSERLSWRYRESVKDFKDGTSRKVQVLGFACDMCMTTEASLRLGVA